MKLFTQKQLQQLQTNLKRKDGIAYVKLFNPSGGGTWYISEIRKLHNIQKHLVWLI